MPLQKISTAIHYVKRPQPGGSADGYSEATWVPNTDVYMCEAGLVIKVELAGMKREDLELSFEGNRVRIRGERSDGCRSGKCQFLVMEINYGPFESVLELPEGYDLLQAKASYLNGFLRIDVPAKTTPAQSINIKVTEL